MTGNSQTSLRLSRAAAKLERAVLGADVGENDQRQDYLRATLSTGDNGETVATAFTKQDSAMLAKFADADCLVVRAPHAPAAKAGDGVDIIRL